MCDMKIYIPTCLKIWIQMDKNERRRRRNNKIVALYNKNYDCNAINRMIKHKYGSVTDRQIRRIVKAHGAQRTFDYSHENLQGIAPVNMPLGLPMRTVKRWGTRPPPPHLALCALLANYICTINLRK